MKRYHLIRFVWIFVFVVTSFSATAGTYSQSATCFVYQYAVPVDNRTAYLWIPPKTDYIRGVIISSANMLENKWMNDSIIRATAAEEKLAMLWIGGRAKGSVLNADMKPGAGEKLDSVMKQFAKITGYPELAYAPFIPTGHSAQGHLSWNLTGWNPKRVIAAIAVKTIPFPDSLKYKDVPTLYMVGQTTEWPQYRDGRKGDRDFFWPVVRNSAVNLRRQNKQNLVAVVTDPGGGHFDWTVKESRFMALYIRKACQYRLPEEYVKNGPVKLKPLQAKDGWLTDDGGMNPDRYSPAPYSRYKGPRNEAYWFFDGELARAAVAFCGNRKEREKQMVTFQQDVHLLNVTKLGFAPLKFKPEKDGITFHVKGGFLNTVPTELVHSGKPLRNAGNKISFSVIDGPVVQVGPNTFQVRFNREGWEHDLWILARSAGNSTFRQTVQPGRVRIPYPIKEGEQQTIHFPLLGSVSVKQEFVKLNATADSGLPVRFFVKYGPAVINGNQLILTDIPAKAIFPLKVVVVAYQWGRIIPPKYQTAKPVQQTIIINR